MKTCYLVGAGEFFAPFEKQPGDFVIAVDGGYDFLQMAQIVPDLLVGDFDSYSGEISDGTIDGIPVERHPIVKDDSDMSLAFQAGFARGYRRFVLLGATGGRADHTMANIQLLSYIKNMGADAVLRFPYEDAFLITNESRLIHGKTGAYLSVFAVGKEAHGVSYEGLSYPLSDATLSSNFPLGLSNEMTKDEATVTVRDGTLLVFVQRIVE